ncbi:hypothetical protein M5K25_005584 [Dendrobium thyrsiflorum]|uniref:Uncharacterized protein n=1 Tax=Dendrobium thyrsiflorum TaxID=117978 RepID=A0ABD0VIA5_DENTH
MSVSRSPLFFLVPLACLFSVQHCGSSASPPFCPSLALGGIADSLRLQCPLRIERSLPEEVAGYCRIQSVFCSSQKALGSSRVHRCLALPTDDVLEEKAIMNQIYRCCVHSWSWKEDTMLWETHTDLMRYPSYIDGASLNEEGWKYVQREVSQHAAHLAPISTLKARSAEIKRREDGSVVEFVENPMSDIANCILYRKWDTKADAFLLKIYDNLSFIPGRRRKEFLDAADWHCVQL